MKVADEPLWMQRMVGICDECRAEVLKLTTTQRFCSDACRIEWHKKRQAKIRQLGKEAIEALETK